MTFLTLNCNITSTAGRDQTFESGVNQVRCGWGLAQIKICIFLINYSMENLYDNEELFNICEKCIKF